MRSIKRSGHLYDQAYEILWEKILAGEIKPGQRLRDVEIYQLFSRHDPACGRPRLAQVDAR
jgi:DNA-binding GntR family transcriptional regulator